MCKMKYVLTFAGFALLLIAPLLGQALGQLYLILLGGMETNQFLQILQSSTLSLQMIGALIIVCGLFSSRIEKTINADANTRGTVLNHSGDRYG